MVYGLWDFMSKAIIISEESMINANTKRRIAETKVNQISASMTCPHGKRAYWWEVLDSSGGTALQRYQSGSTGERIFNYCDHCLHCDSCKLWIISDVHTPSKNGRYLDESYCRKCFDRIGMSPTNDWDN